MPLKLDDIVPNFDRPSIASNIDFYSWAGDSWVILFSYPKKFTNIDKLELDKIGALKSEFDKRNVKAVVLSLENLNSDNRWLSKLEATPDSTINYPILLDPERKIFELYGINTPGDRETEAMRSVLTIDPDRKLCGYIATPVTTEYNFDEIIKKIDSVQLIDRSILPPSPTSFGKIAQAKYIQDVRKFLLATDNEKAIQWVPPPTDLIEEPQQIISDPIAPAQTPADRANLLTRYSNLDCPDTTPINIAFSIYAQLLIEPPDAEAKPVTIQDTGSSQLPQIEVVLRARGFDIEGSNTQIMEIDRERDSEVRFILKPSQLGEQQIRVDFYQYGKPISTIRHNILVGDLQSDRQVSQPEKDPIVEFKIDPNIPPPDLEICIELDRHDDRTLYFELHSIKENIDYNHAKFGQIELKDSPNEKMQAVYQELSAFAAIDPRKFRPKSTTLVRIDRDAQTKAEQRIAAVGNQLWDTLIPQELQAEYWQFKAKGVKSILITSDEPWVPWEIIKPYRRNPQNVEEQEPFWCEQFAISRWLSGAGTADELPIELVIPVAPNIVNLPAVAAEITFLQHLNMIRPGIKTIQPIGGSLALKDYLKAQPNFSLLHFACHGGFNSTLPNDSAIQLSDDDCLRPSDIHLYFDRPFTRPLIFINACDGGRQGFSFTGLGGWAQCLVKARVGAFAGAMWEVNDTLALEFAKHFYQALLQDKQTIGEAFQQARAVIRKQAPYNSTWLAYTLYADPEARLAQTAKIAA